MEEEGEEQELSSGMLALRAMVAELDNQPLPTSISGMVQEDSTSHPPSGWGPDTPPSESTGQGMTLKANNQAEKKARRMQLTDIPNNHPGSSSTSKVVTASSGDGKEEGKKAGKKKEGFKVDTSLIQAVPLSQQASDLQELGLDLNVYNQEEFEQGIMAQVDKAMGEAEEKRKKSLLENWLRTVEGEIKTVSQELIKADTVLKSTLSMPKNRETIKKIEEVMKHKENKSKQMKRLRAKRKSFRQQLNGDKDPEEAEADSASGDVMASALGLPVRTETLQEKMVRLGQMTPFGTVMKFSNDKVDGTAEGKKNKPQHLSDFEKYFMAQDKLAKGKVPKKSSSQEQSEQSKTPAQNDSSPKTKKKRKVDEREGSTSGDKRKRENIFDAKDKRVYHSGERDYSNWKQYRRKSSIHHNFSEDGVVSDCDNGDDAGVYMDSEDEWKPARDQAEFDDRDADDDAYTPGEDGEEEHSLDKIKEKMGVAKKRKSSSSARSSSQSVSRSKDDGNMKAYERRYKEYQKNEARRKFEKIHGGQEEEGGGSSDSDDDVELDGGMKVPGQIWKKLYAYQKTGVKWLWELHWQQVGGILGDEMGLGKTIQIIAFLAGLKISNVKLKDERFQGLGAVLIVCPATVLYQWVQEFHKWWPPFRVAILHGSGSFTSSEAELVRSIVRNCGVLITTYSTCTIQQDLLLHYDWHYVILDEGHKIRNPDAKVTQAVKQFRTAHRIILSGSPMQNNLKELWSVFDFVFPGKLGTMPDFMAHFSVPITQGGYSNASQVQVQTAYKCACILRDTISPYLVRRMKADVKINLPSKNEQVLFCRLSKEQEEVYMEYLQSRECKQILAGKFMVFPGLITLRKICNHPDLSTGGPRSFMSETADMSEDERQYGYYKRSGKLIVVESLLKLWKKQEHKVLLFSQSTQMLDILESFVQNVGGYTYLRIDGTTPISSRQGLITKFNEDPSLFVFLLTTRVGGLGVNLTGANRIIIFDPDWNPSTDTQARERAWRIGQKKNVTIYRLITTGSIEEKIYHRQIFKQFLTNRVLQDPKQQRFFKSNDLHELFSLGSQDQDIQTETSAIFAGVRADVDVRAPKKQEPEKLNRFDKIREEKDAEKEAQAAKKEKDVEKKDKAIQKKNPDQEKLEKMREMARLLSQKIGMKKSAEGSKGNEEGKKEGSEDKEGKLQKSDESSQPGLEGKSMASKEEGSPDNTLVDTQAGRKTSGKDVKSSSRTKHRSKDKQHSHNSSGKHSHRKKKKKKRRKDIVFEGEQIQHLDKVTTMDNTGNDEDLSAKQDDFVLRRLFKSSGVHSAVQHDKIMGISNPDYALVEGEAERVAREAAKALKRSRARCLRAVEGVPTWTGASGQSGAPGGPKPRFGRKKSSTVSATVSKPAPTPVAEKKPRPEMPKLFSGEHVQKPKDQKEEVVASTDLLTEMRTRNHLKLNDGQATSATQEEVEVPVDTEDQELLTDLRNYIAFGGAVDGQASTQEILDQFGPRLPPQNSAKFRSMLNELCDFNKMDGLGYWKLKPDFR